MTLSAILTEYLESREIHKRIRSELEKEVKREIKNRAKRSSIIAVCREIGVHPVWYHRWISGRRGGVSEAVLMRMAMALRKEHHNANI